MRDAQPNGTGATAATDPEIVTPTGNAYPMPRNHGQIERANIKWGVVGFGLGVAITLFILHACSKKFR